MSIVGGTISIVVTQKSIGASAASTRGAHHAILRRLPTPNNLGVYRSCDTPLNYSFRMLLLISTRQVPYPP